jgi:hypothetical protein
MKKRKLLRKIHLVVDISIYDSAYTIRDFYEIIKVFRDIHGDDHLKIEIKEKKELPCKKQRNN